MTEDGHWTLPEEEEEELLKVKAAAKTLKNKKENLNIRNG
jgi:hypothetical protein